MPLVHRSRHQGRSDSLRGAHTRRRALELLERASDIETSFEGAGELEGIAKPRRLRPLPTAEFSGGEAEYVDPDGRPLVPM